MAYSRKLLTVGAMGVAAFALIGAGATATFSDQVSGTQTVKTGTLKMVAVGNGASTSGKVVTWTTGVQPVGSTFTTGKRTITIRNDSNIPVTRTTLTQSVRPRGSSAARDDALYNGIWVKINAHAGATNLWSYTGRLSALETEKVIRDPFPANTKFDVDVEYYAGGGDVPTLPNGAQGAAITADWKIAFEG